MKILVLNRGSSSIKCCIYEFKSQPSHPPLPIWEAHLTWKNNFDDPYLTIQNQDHEGIPHRVVESSPDTALTNIFKNISIGSLEEIDVIGHRIVHGGSFYTDSVIVTPEVKQNISHLCSIAPLHNPAGLAGIEIMEKLIPNKPQIAVFDTAFHHTLSPEVAIYPIPYKRFEEGIKRYGFHGISFQYCFRRAQEILKKDLHSAKVVICHLGSGASLCAIHEGKSIDTTMGFTPLEGLMMDTRSGTIDPGIILHLLQNQSTTIDELTAELNFKAGLLGISGNSSDMRDIIEKAEAGEAPSTLALKMYLHRLNGLIGSMIASLKGIDLLIFTAGIGENAPLIRKKVCSQFSFLGLKLDEVKNENVVHQDTLLSTSDSKMKILVIHTQEAYEIARECWKKLMKK